MNRLLLFFISALMSISINTYGQNTYTGKIVGKANPCPPSDYPCVPCVVLWLETDSGNYVLSFNSHWICNDKIIVDDIEYRIDDEVEITGTVSVSMDMHLEEYFNLEIESIKKLTSNIESLPSGNNRVYYDATKKVIVIDEILQSQSLKFELVDLQGKIVLRKTGMGNNNSINVAGLLNGVYLYRLMQNDQVIYCGKILKTN